MAIIIDNDLPAADLLRQEGFAVLSPEQAPDDRLRIALVNLMPVKTDTELDFMRLIAASPCNVEIALVHTATHTSRHTPAHHIARFYRTFPDTVAAGNIHGAIITGAPLEFVSFEQVDYWAEITSIFDHLRQHRTPTLYVCWAAFAALYYHYGIPMDILPEKISGVFRHRILQPDHALMRDVPQEFTIPHSRFATWHSRHITDMPALRIIAKSTEAGIYMAAHTEYPEHYITGHGEYTRLTLDGEYRRDTAKGMHPAIPSHYYPDDNPDAEPSDTWHETATRIMCNWIDSLPY